MSKIPAGTYKGRAIKGSEQHGFTSKGTEQIVIDLEVTVPMAGDVEEKKRLSTFMYFSDAAAPYSLERLRALGWQGDDVMDLVGIDANEVDVSVRYEDYQGEDKMKVEILTGGGRVVVKEPMNDSQKRVFAARMKTLAKSGTPATAPAQPAAARAGGRARF